jgi:hypothetical protein
VTISITSIWIVSVWSAIDRSHGCNNYRSAKARWWSYYDHISSAWWWWGRRRWSAASVGRWIIIRILIRIVIISVAMLPALVRIIPLTVVIIILVRTIIIIPILSVEAYPKSRTKK